MAATLLQGQFNQDAQIQKNILGQGQNQDSAIQGQLAQDQQNQDAQIQNHLNGKKRHLMSFLPNIGQDINTKVSGCHYSCRQQRSLKHRLLSLMCAVKAALVRYPSSLAFMLSIACL